MTDGNGHHDPATPQEIWEMLREISAAQQETDRQMQETDRRLQETDQLLTRQARAADRRMAKLDELFNGQWGKLIESLVEGDLVGLLQRRGIAVQHTVTNPRQNYGERRWEFDIVAITRRRSLLRHVLPNIAAPIIIIFSINVGGVIMSEAALSFIEFGLPPDIPSWGGMLSREGRQYMEMTPHLALWPGVCLTVVVYSLNLFGDAVRDLLDPRLRGRLGRYGAARK